MTHIVYPTADAAGAAAAPSPSIWKDCDVLGIIQNPGLGIHKYEDWRDKSWAATLTSGTEADGYVANYDTGGSVLITPNTSLVTASARGISHYVTMDTDAGDDDEIGFQYVGGGTTGTPFFVIKKGHGRVWFETIVKTDTVTTGVAGTFIGLTDEDYVAGDHLVNDTMTLKTDTDFLGFHIKADDGDALDCIYQTSGVTMVTALAGDENLTANTWTKLGLTYDGNETITYWIDGAPVKTVDIDATGFPDGEELLPTWIIKDVTTTDMTLDIGWWRGAWMYGP